MIWTHREWISARSLWASIALVLTVTAFVDFLSFLGGHFLPAFISTLCGGSAIYFVCIRNYLRSHELRIREAEEKDWWYRELLHRTEMEEEE